MGFTLPEKVGVILYGLPCFIRCKAIWILRYKGKHLFLSTDLQANLILEALS